ncbi:MAG: hypothetical protein NC483_00605 [Ruminococcus sp.]|nr:hypothetical protein [Ruminococcus sp.]
MIDGITLLEKIKNNEIKDNTKIKVIYDDGLSLFTRTIITYINEELIWKNGEFKASMLWNSFYSFEIIESRPEEISEIDLKLDSFTDSYYDVALVKLLKQSEEIRIAVNYLLKREDDQN